MAKKKADKRKIRAFSMLSMKRGMPRKDEIKRESACSICDKVLPSGTVCLSFPHAKGFTNYHRLCKDCASLVIKKSREDFLITENLFKEVYE